MAQAYIAAARRGLGVVPMSLHPGLRLALDVLENYLFGITGIDNQALIQPQGSAAQPFYGRQVVTHEQYSSSLLCYLTHLAQTLLLESSVANSEHFIHQKDLWF